MLDSSKCKATGFIKQLTLERIYRSVSIVAAGLLSFTAPSILYADDFSCGEWSKASLQHKGPISITINNDKLEWSNGKNTYEANIISNNTPQLAYADTASIYMIYGVYTMKGRLYNSGYLRVRRVFFVEEMLKVSEIECE